MYHWSAEFLGYLNKVVSRIQGYEYLPFCSSGSSLASVIWYGAIVPCISHSLDEKGGEEGSAPVERQVRKAYPRLLCCSQPVFSIC